MRRSIAITIAIVAVLGVAVGTIVWYVAKPPSTSEFYSTPSGISHDKPGTVVRSEKITPSVPGAKLWRIVYTSTDIRGRIVPVSALVAVPAGAAPKGGFPLVSVAHGTIGINRGCAPSLKPFAMADKTDTSYEFLVGQYVDAGYATVMTDFEGLGVKGRNSYLVGEIEGRNVLDAIRAIHRFDRVDVQSNTLVAGQSQGGHAALFAGQLAASYAPDLTITGVVAQAPATDLASMFGTITKANKRGGIVSLPVMAADAYTQNYADVALGDVLTTRGRGSLRNVVGRTCLIPSLIGTSLARPSDLFRPNGLDVLAPYVRRNTPGADLPMPVFIAQGEIDGVVSPATTTEYAKQVCAAGGDLTYVTYPGVGHFDVVHASTADALRWMKSVRNGHPPPTCQD